MSVLGGGKHPTVSVVVPLWNRERFIRRCLESVQACDLDELEILVVDDGSTDDGPEIVRQCAASDCRIRLLQHPGNGQRGVSAARNLGLKHADGKYVAFLDSDDCYQPWRFGSCVKILESHPFVDGVYSNACRTTESGEMLGELTVVESRPTADKLADPTAEFFPRGLIGTGAITLRKSLLATIGSFPIDKIVGEDLSVWYRAFAAGHLVPDTELRPVVEYTTHEGNTTGFDPAVIHAREFGSVFHWARRRNCSNAKLDFLRDTYVGYLYWNLQRYRQERCTTGKQLWLLWHAAVCHPRLLAHSQFQRNIVRSAFLQPLGVLRRRGEADSNELS